MGDVDDIDEYNDIEDDNALVWRLMILTITMKTTSALMMMSVIVVGER